MCTEWRKNIGIAAGLFVLGALVGWSAKRIDSHLPTSRGSASKFGGDAAQETAGQNRGLNAIRKEPATQTGAFLARMHDILSVGDSRKRDRLIAGIADDLDAAQIREALAQLDRVQISERHEVRKVLLARWGELAPLEALTFAQTLPGPLERNESVEAVVSGWTEHDAAAAEKWVTALPEGVMKRTAMQSLVGGIAATDPKHALSLAKDLSRLSLTFGWSGEAPPLLHAVLDKWIQDDPQAAAAAVADLPDGIARSNGMELVAKGWAESDFDRAAAWAEAQAQSPRLNRRSALSGVLDVLLRKDANAAVGWIKQMPDGPDKAAVLQMASTNAASSGADSAATMELTLMLPRGLIRENDLYFNLRSWAEKDPQAALTWAGSQSEDRVRGNAEIAAAGSWLERDSAGASEWMAARPAGPEKDALIQGAIGLVINGNKWGAIPLIKFMSPESVQSAPQWIAQISNPDQREKSYEKLAEKWLDQEPQSATAWIQSSPLPQEVKDRLLSGKAQ